MDMKMELEDIVSELDDLRGRLMVIENDLHVREQRRLIGVVVDDLQDVLYRL